MYETLGGFSGNETLRNRPLMFSIQTVQSQKNLANAGCFGENIWKSVQNYAKVNIMRYAPQDFICIKGLLCINVIYQPDSKTHCISNLILDLFFYDCSFLIHKNIHLENERVFLKRFQMFHWQPFLTATSQNVSAISISVIAKT